MYMYTYRYRASQYLMMFEVGGDEVTETAKR